MHTPHRQAACAMFVLTLSQFTRQAADPDAVGSVFFGIDVNEDDVLLVVSIL